MSHPDATLRDFFAAYALSHIAYRLGPPLSGTDEQARSEKERRFREAAHECYQWADAMLDARRREVAP